MDSNIRPESRLRFRNALVITCALVSACLSACAMSNSALINATSGQLGCETNAGVYYLGRTLFHVEVSKPDETDNYYLGGVTPVRRVDGNHGFCLDYTGSITSEEAFVVRKTSDGLLQQISSSSDDKSAEIAKTFAQTFFVALSNNAKFPSASEITTKSSIQARVGATKVVDQTYDPYDEADTALLNNAIKDFGFCMVMDDQVFHGYQDIDNYCNEPLRHAALEKSLQKVSQKRGPERSVYDNRQGIFYRPRRTRTVYLFLKQDLHKIRGTWKLRASQAVALENNSPIMFVGIDRTFFAKRDTTVQFDDGALTDIQIVKKSELVGFVSIPLYIAQSIVALPSNIIQVKIDQTNDRAKLIRAREDLIKAETALLDLQKQTAAGTNGSTGGTTKANVLEGQVRGVISKAQTGEARCREREKYSQPGQFSFERCMQFEPQCRDKHPNDESAITSCIMTKGLG